jgi:transposase
VHAVLENEVKLILANAYQIKHTPGRKTDSIDSEWIAEVALNNLIDPSRIFPKEERDLRRLTRTRESLVKIRSQIKNQVHQGLESCSIKLSSVLSDNFGKSGRHILDGLIQGKSVDCIIEEIPSKRVKKNEDQIRAAIRTGLDETQVFLIQSHLNTIDGLTKKLEEIDSEIKHRVSGRKGDLEIAMSVPGIGFKAATTILAEIITGISVRQINLLPGAESFPVCTSRQISSLREELQSKVQSISAGCWFKSLKLHLKRETQNSESSF